MPFATVTTAAVAFLVGAVLGWWPLAAWTQRSMKSERMSQSTVRVAGAAITAVTFATLALSFGLALILPALLVFAAAASVLTLVDLAEKRLPNAVIFPTLGAVAVLLVPPTWASGEWAALLGAAAGAAAMFAVYFLLALISPSSMGMGDVKLALVIGLLLGWFGLNAWLVGTDGGVRGGRAGRDRGAGAAPGDPAGIDPVRSVDAGRGIRRVAAGGGAEHPPSSPRNGAVAREALRGLHDVVHVALLDSGRGSPNRVYRTRPEGSPCMTDAAEDGRPPCRHANADGHGTIPVVARLRCAHHDGGGAGRCRHRA